MRNHKAKRMMQQMVLTAGVVGASLIPGFAVLAGALPEGTTVYIGSVKME